MSILEGRPEGLFWCFLKLTNCPQVSMAVILWKAKRTLKSTSAKDNISSVFPLSLFVRSLTFAVYIFIGIGFVSAGFYKNKGGDSLSSLELEFLVSCPFRSTVTSFGR